MAWDGYYLIVGDGSCSSSGNDLQFGNKTVCLVAKEDEAYRHEAGSVAMARSAGSRRIAPNVYRRDQGRRP
jgi:hypothetical protein